MHWDVGKVGGRVEQLVRRIDLFKLNVGATEVVNEFGEDTGVGFNCAPAHVFFRGFLPCESYGLRGFVKKRVSCLVSSLQIEEKVQTTRIVCELDTVLVLL